MSAIPADGPSAVSPNYSFDRTRYGKRRSPGLQHTVSSQLGLTAPASAGRFAQYFVAFAATTVRIRQWLRYFGSSPA